MESKEFHLCKGCKKKDAKTQYELFHTYVKRYIAICERYVEQNDDAKDLVQECFITIFNKIDSFEWQGEHSFEKWMRRIVANIGVNYYQKNKTKRNISIDVSDDIAEEKYEEIEITGFDELQPDHLNNYQISDEDLLESLKIIPEHFRVVFNMHVLDNYSHKDIAEELGITEKTSTTRLFRARKLLQKELAGRLKIKEYANR